MSGKDAAVIPQSRPPRPARSAPRSRGASCAQTLLRSRAALAALELGGGVTKTGGQYLVRCPVPCGPHRLVGDLRGPGRPRPALLSSRMGRARCDRRAYPRLWPVGDRPAAVSCQSASLRALGATPTIWRARRRSCGRAIPSAARSRLAIWKGATSRPHRLCRHACASIRRSGIRGRARTGLRWSCRCAISTPTRSSASIGLIWRATGAAKRRSTRPHGARAAQGRVHQADARRGRRRRTAHRRRHRNLPSLYAARFPADVVVRRRRRHPGFSGVVGHRVPDHRGRSRSRRTHAAQTCAERWQAAGHEVFIRWPDALGRDFADGDAA